MCLTMECCVHGLFFNGTKENGTENELQMSNE